MGDSATLENIMKTMYGQFGSGTTGISEMQHMDQTEGREVPYTGYIWNRVSVPFMKDEVVEALALVTLGTDYNLKVSVVVGTSFISR